MFDFLKAGYQKIKGALAKTRGHLFTQVKALLGRPLDEETYEQIEKLLFELDMGRESVEILLAHLKHELRFQPTSDVGTILDLLREKALSLLPPPLDAINRDHHPHVALIVGVNGSGKTTSIGKLAAYFQRQGKKVLLAAADTFRAAAIDQLEILARRLSIDIVKGAPGSDPSSVVFDALQAAKSREIDLLLIDTAGRLQNKTDLMEELKKIRSVCAKGIPGAPHETLLVLDGTTGQNALDQVRTFHQFTPLSGILLSKLDGSARGGVILPIYREAQVPVLFIGTGEGIEDLAPFDPISYVATLFSKEEET